MPDQTPSLPFVPATLPRRWRIVMHNSETRVVEAHSFRCEAGCLVLVLPVGAAAAYAAGTWATVEQVPE